MQRLTLEEKKRLAIRDCGLDIVTTPQEAVAVVNRLHEPPYNVPFVDMVASIGNQHGPNFSLGKRIMVLAELQLAIE